MNEYTLLPAQKDFLEIEHEHKIDVAIYQGGYGSGKTWSGALLGILLAQKYPGIKGLVGAKTFKLVSETTLQTYFEHLRNMKIDYEFNKTDHKIKFKNSSEIMFKYLDEPESLKSLNLGFVEIEEVSDVPEASFFMLLSRLRQSGIPRYRLFGHTNPEPNKGWIYKHFVENEKENYRLLIAPTTENIHLPDEYIDNMKDKFDPDYYKINVLGQFGDYTKGLVVKHFTGVNIKNNIEYKDDETLFIGCDFNVDPMSWVVFFVRDGAFYFFDEIVIENTTTKDAAEEFIHRYPHHKGKIVITGDASGDYRKTSSIFTDYAIIFNQLKKYGYRPKVKIRNFNPSVNSRIAAFNAKVLNQNGKRELFVNPRCKWLLHNIRNLKYKEGTTQLDVPSHQQIKTDRNAKFMGHIFDAASYPIEFFYPIKVVRR